MTQAECEIVAQAGMRLREIALGITFPASTTLSDLHPGELVGIMDRAALAISEIYGALSALPLEAESA